MNLKIREFKMSLEKYIESTDIPWEVKKLILKELYEKAVEESDKSVLGEIKERDSIEQEESWNE